MSDVALPIFFFFDSKQIFANDAKISRSFDVPEHGTGGTVEGPMRGSLEADR